jgi:hypothetical protein
MVKPNRTHINQEGKAVQQPALHSGDMREKTDGTTSEIAKKNQRKRRAEIGMGLYGRNEYSQSISKDKGDKYNQRSLMRCHIHVAKNKGDNN